MVDIGNIPSFITIGVDSRDWIPSVGNKITIQFDRTIYLSCTVSGIETYTIDKKKCYNVTLETNWIIISNIYSSPDQIVELSFAK